MQNNIPIFLASDENYAPFLCTTMYSILENTNSFIEFYVLDNGIEEDSKEIIFKSLKSFNNYSVEYLSLKDFDLNRFPNLNHYSLSTYARYFIPNLKPKLGKVLYLDVDIIVKSDISELFNQELGNYPLGAVLEDFYGRNGLYIKKYIDPNFKSGKKSFNCGVLLMDVQKFIENNYMDLLVNKTVELFDRLSCPDQDVFNIIFENNYKILDYKFNFMIDLYDKYKAKSSKLAQELMQNHCIIHYIIEKPWKSKKITCFE